jgi:preprotein translocase subunit SecD
MDRNLMWRGILILAVVLIFGLAAYPLDERINLGLDLRGGMHLVLDVEAADALNAETERTMQLVSEQAREEGAPSATATRIDDESFTITGASREQVDAALDEIFGGPQNRWDLSWSGDTASFAMTAGERADVRNTAVTQALQTIRNRVDAYGVAEPVIQRVGLDDTRILVQLPGVDDPERVRGLLNRTSFLEFRLVDFPMGGNGAGSREEILAHYGGTLPSHLEIGEEVRRNDQGQEIGRLYYGLEKQQVITGRDLRDARPSQGEFGTPVVSFTLNREGAGRFADVTSNNIGRGLAILLDGQVVSAPNIRGRIADRGQIEGIGNLREVEDLSMTLRSGALPARINYLEERTVGPSLGRDSIEQGLRAGLIGFLLVVVAMLVIYKLTGVNAVIALALDVVLVFGGLALLQATLTLPGIAGIILTIGMAVDANVLVFERIKEELRLGRTVKSAIDAGFGKALSSILDANITTLIAALFLFQFGSGPIKGFAVTLSIGIFASVFTAVFVSRFLFDLLLSRRQRVEKLSI